MNAPAKKNEVVTIEATPPALQPDGGAMALLRAGATPEQIKELMILQERWDATQARKAFNEAMSAAKAEIPVIKKNRHVGFDSKRTDSRTDYDHEDLAEIARTIDPILSKFGLSYRFRTEADDSKVKVTCIISHRLGHSEENSLPALHDKSGNKNPIQAIGSTVTFLQRYTLKAALGLAAAKDDDGKSSGAGETITDEQVQEISDLLTKTNSNLVRFLEKIKLESLTQIGSDKFDTVVKLIKDTAAKRAALAKEPAQ